VDAKGHDALCAISQAMEQFFELLTGFVSSGRFHVAPGRGGA
jgi:hypothetical protein